MKNLNSRQKNILTLLSRIDDYLKGQVICEHLNISLRTLQTEIADINAKKAIIISSNRGYKLYKENIESITLFDEEEKSRYHEILKNLMINNVDYNFDELADLLYLSSTTLSLRIKELNNELNQFNLNIKRKNNRLWIEGNELNKRKYINKMILKEVDPNFNNFDGVISFFDGIDVARMKSIILNSIHKHDYFIEENYSINLFINIIIALYRMRENSYVEALPNNSINTTMPEYKIAKDICLQYANHWTINPSTNDIIYIAIMISGQIKPVKLTVNDEATHSDILTNEFVQEINSILLNVFNYYMLDINFSDQLYNFSIHIDALIKRSCINNTSKNTFWKTIKTNCPFIYDVAVMIANKIADKYNITINDEEIGYISVHIGFLIENSTIDTERINILLHCNDYHDIDNKISIRLNEHYSQFINIRAIKHPITETDIDSEIDLIVTTKSINIIGKKVVVISPFYTMMDHIEVDNAIHSCIKEKELNQQNKLLISYFHEKLFFIDENIDNKLSAINFLGQKVIDFGLTSNGFIASVIKREELSSTCFFETFAIPHSIEMNAKKTMFCVLINPKGIKWNESRIKIVLMIAVQQADRKEFMKIYNGIIRALWNQETVMKLVKSNSLFEFIMTLKNNDLN